jgi:hypothetical protein
VKHKKLRAWSKKSKKSKLRRRRNPFLSSSVVIQGKEECSVETNAETIEQMRGERDEANLTLAIMRCRHDALQREADTLKSDLLHWRVENARLRDEIKDIKEPRWLKHHVQEFFFGVNPLILAWCSLWLSAFRLAGRSARWFWRSVSFNPDRPVSVPSLLMGIGLAFFYFKASVPEGSSTAPVVAPASIAPVSTRRWL